MFFINFKNKDGITLIEIVLYIAIFTAILLAGSTLYNTAMQSRAKSQTMAEVEQQGLQLMQLITQTIRNATALNSPTIGTSASSLSLNVSVGANSPTIFDLASGQVRIKEGAAAAVPLTNSRVVASGLNFYNLSRLGTDNILRIEFTLSHINPSNLQEYSYTKTFYSSASLR